MRGSGKQREERETTEDNGRQREATEGNGGHGGPQKATGGKIRANNMGSDEKIKREAKQNKNRKRSENHTI